MADDTLEATIDNWARWHRNAMRWHKGHCASLEQRWRSKQPWDAVPLTIQGAIDQPSALGVEAAWRTLAHVPKMVLKWHYVFARAPGSICRSLRPRGYAALERNYPLVLVQSKIELGQALASQKKTEYDAAVAVVRAPKPQWEGFALVGAA